MVRPSWDIADDFGNAVTAIPGVAEIVLRQDDPSHPATPHVVRLVNASDEAAALTRELRSAGPDQGPPNSPWP